MTLTRKIGDAVLGILSILLLIVPYSLPAWHFVVGVSPEASMMQHAFLFVLLTIFAILTGIGYLVIWGVGCVFIVVWILMQIWMFLG